MSLHEVTPYLNTELQLLLLLSYPGAATIWPEQIPRLLAEVNQIELIRLIGFHRVALAVNRNLLPQWRQLLSLTCLAQLEQLARQQQQQIRLQYLQHSRIEKAFNEAGITHRFFKGLALSQMLYQDLGWRYSRDIDILVATEDEAKACIKLKQLGYVSEFDGLPAIGFGTRVRKALKKDTVFKRVDGTLIELHVRLDSANSKFGRFMTTHYLSQPKGLSVEEFVYLCFHAAKTKCHRIKWLIDIAFYANQLNEKHNSWQVDAEKTAKKYGVFAEFNLMMILLQFSFSKLVVNTCSPDANPSKEVDAILLSWDKAYLPKRADWDKATKSFYKESNLVDNLKMALNIIFSPNHHEINVLNSLPKPINYLFFIILPFYKMTRYLLRSALSKMTKLVKGFNETV